MSLWIEWESLSLEAGKNVRINENMEQQNRSDEEDDDCRRTTKSKALE